MLSTPTPFPQPGSYALLTGDGGHDLARILSVPARPGDFYLVSLPFIADSSGTRRVGFDQLTDATPLSHDEGREMVDLERELRGERVRGRAKKSARYAELRDRALYAPILALRLRELHSRQAKAAA